jgi:hypothetical protein
MNGVFVRAGCGLLVAAIVNSILLAVLLPLGTVLSGPAVAVTFLVFLPFSVVFALVFGVPAYLLARKFERLNVYAAIGLGLACGAIVGTLLAVTRVGAWIWVPQTMGTAAISALAGYPLLRWRRPALS